MTPDANGTSGRDVFAAQVADTFTRLGWVRAGASDDPDTRTLLADVGQLRDALDKELAFLGLNGNLDLIDEATADSTFPSLRPLPWPRLPPSTRTGCPRRRCAAFRGCSAAAGSRTRGSRRTAAASC